MRAKACLIAATLIFFGIMGWTGYGQRQRPSQPGWEYKVVYLPGARNMTESALNELGSQGWELVTFQPFNREGVTIGAANYYFKREKRER